MRERGRICRATSDSTLPQINSIDSRSLSLDPHSLSRRSHSLTVSSHSSPSSETHSFPHHANFHSSSPRDPFHPLAVPSASVTPPDSPRINAYRNPNLPPPPNSIEIASFSPSSPLAPSTVEIDFDTPNTFPLTDSPLLFGPTDFIPALANSSENAPRAIDLLNLSQFTQRYEPMLSFEAGEPAEERRYFALAELLETERTYFQSLKVLVKVSPASTPSFVTTLTMST